ncbi:hypothetical protein AG1IA_10277 [Rhizoctonia solani AG-1 IA]|uniref:Uncharacterized protein n=1 Tax=Thanatephorus cucumeris (strain AG1-IA) TaxID=983506 RepID=L8WFY1_THACA|nr:hypothetical protein AG1IA_10277 [Rhizoctonia solani AG-1 IA]
MQPARRPSITRSKGLVLDISLPVVCPEPLCYRATPSDCRYATRCIRKWRKHPRLRLSCGVRRASY